MSDFSRWVRDLCIDFGVDRAAAAKFERDLRREWAVTAATSPKCRAQTRQNRPDATLRTRGRAS